MTRHTHHKRDSTYKVIILLFWDGLDGEPYGAWPYIGTCLTFMYGIGMVSTCHALLGKSKIVDDRERPSFRRTKEGKNIINIILYSWKERERVPDPSQRSSSHGFVRSLLFGRVFLSTRSLSGHFLNVTILKKLGLLFFPAEKFPAHYIRGEITKMLMM